MRRKDREVTNPLELLEIIRKCSCCNISFFDQEYPYVIPVNFGVVYQEDVFTFYFHGAKEGKKIELLKRNPSVGFSMNCSNKLHLGEVACDSTMEFESICGNGIMEIIEDTQERKRALSYLMQQYQKDREHHFSDAMVNTVALFKLSVHEISGKRLTV